jgi:Xaa-Pro aminopeptidase
VTGGDRLVARMAEAAERAAAAGLAGLLVTPSADLVYLAGYDPPPLERLTCLLLRPGADPVLVVPELEKPRAQASPGGRAVEVAGWRDDEDPYELVGRMLPNGARYGISHRALAVHALQLVGRGFDLVPASRAGLQLRVIKDADEIALLSTAGAAADRAFQRIAQGVFAGRTEADVAADLGRLLLEEGNDAVAFTIVGSGPNAASPHHEPGRRPIAPGDAVVLDFGGWVGGYCSDVTRTVVVGDAPPRFHEVYEVVREAQERAFHAIRPGTPAEDVNRVARDVIEKAGFGEWFIHRTGHGIGLEEHEPPYIVAGNHEPFAPACVSRSSRA